MFRHLLAAALPAALIAQAPTPVRLVGRILGPNAKPLIGAVVALEPVSDGTGLSPIREQRTNAKGQFTLKSPAGRYGLTVTAQGCLPHFRNVDLTTETAALPLEIRLENGGCRIQGRLLSADGLLLEGARVGFSKFSEDQGDQFYGDLKKGHFDVTLAPGDYLAYAEAKGQAGSQRMEVRGNLPNAFIQLRAEPTPAGPETLAWIKRNAIPLQGVEAGKGFADMQPLKSLVGEATVVALGEATHGAREFFQLKHRMLEFLATEMGFTVFAIEANLPEAFAVNEYVLTGKGDPAAALAGLYFWTWDTEEVLDMIRWMRSYNEDPAHLKKLRFYGVDMQTETVAFLEAKKWLNGLDPDEAARLITIKEGMAKLPKNNLEKASEAHLKAWDSAVRELEALIARIDARKFLGDDADRQHQNLRVLAQFAAMHANIDGNYKVRDESMAANLRWIQAREQGAKIVLWAHNGHISLRAGGLMGANTMGWHLRQSLGKAYLPIGFAFREGGFQAVSNGNLRALKVQPQPKGTLDAALSASGKPIFALDLRNRPSAGPVKRWLESPQGTWSIGALFTPGQEAGYLEKEPITGDYDALLFVNRTTTARPVDGHKTSNPPKPVSAKTPVNLGFEEDLKGWSNPQQTGCVIRIANTGAKEGNRCLQIAFEGEQPNSFATSMQAVDATSYRGKNVRLSGWIRTDAKPDFKAVFWMRVDGKSGTGFFDNMMQRPVTSADWTQVSIEGPVAEDAVNLNFGCMTMGKGTAWYDGLELEVRP